MPDSTQGYPNDIALVQLDTFLDPESYTAPICLPEYNEDFVGKTCYVTGWGYTERKYSVLLRNVDGTDKTIYRGLF